MTHEDHPKPPQGRPDTGADQAEQQESLSTVGELVQAGGNRAAVGILTYLVIGTAFWSLLGFVVDNLVGTQWMVYVGAGIGLVAGILLSYLRLQAGLRITEDPEQDSGASRNRRTAPYPSAAEQSRHGGTRKDRQ